MFFNNREKINYSLDNIPSSPLVWQWGDESIVSIYSTRWQDGFGNGFERDKAQVLHFHLELYLAWLNPFKILVNGELVDEPWFWLCFYLLELYFGWGDLIYTLLIFCCIVGAAGFLICHRTFVMFLGYLYDINIFLLFIFWVSTF